jgi:hypothetical protein
MIFDCPENTFLADHLALDVYQNGRGQMNDDTPIGAKALFLL